MATIIFFFILGGRVGVKTIGLEDKKSIIIDFLNKCNLYSDQKLLDYDRRLVKAGDVESTELGQKKHDWASYRDFNAHAIAELKGNELDDWL